MNTRTRSSRWLPLLGITTLFACRDGGTGPEDRLRLTPGRAEPFSLVEVANLPEAYGSAQKLDISVGGATSILLFDPVDKVHRFMVPDLAPGSAEVVIPSPDGKKSLKTAVEVLPRKYVGGSPEAALDEMDVLLDSMQVSLSYGLAVVDPKADSSTYGRVEAFITLAEALQEHAETLTPQDRAALAGLFSAAAPDLRALSADIAAGIAELRDQPPLLPGAAAVTAPLSASALVSRCVDYDAMLGRLDRLSDIMSYVAIAANGLSWFAGPAVRAAVGILTASLTLSMDLAVIIANSVPRLIDPNGLRLQVSPARLRHDGGTGTMSVWVRRRASGEVLGTALGTAMDMNGVISAIRNYEAARKLVNWAALGAAVGSVVKDLFVLEALEYLDEKAADLMADHILPAGEVQVTFEGISFTAGSPSSRWEFTGPATASSRGIRSVGQNQQAIETFPVAARLGSSTRCTAQTTAPNPAGGINGFEIASTARVRFLPLGPGSSVDVNAGSAASATLTVANEGAQASGTLTYRLQNAQGQAYTPPTWLTLGAPSGPSSLSPAAQGTVRISISAAGDALQQQLVVPVAVLENGKVIDNAYVQIRVMPQLSDIVINKSPSTLRLWDHGTQDGDIITVTLNGSPVASALSLTNSGVSLPITYRRGRNILIVRAHNEGSLRPNTAALGFANVVRGSATQTYGLSTGATTQLVITYDPSAASMAANQQAPAPAYTRCTPQQRGDCRP